MTMTSKMTNGPWRIAAGSKETGFVIESDRLVALPSGHGARVREHVAIVIGQANARAIVAVPELIEALRQAADLLDMAQSCIDNKQDSDRVYAGCEAARLALRKAGAL